MSKKFALLLPALLLCSCGATPLDPIKSSASQSVPSSQSQSSAPSSSKPSTPASSSSSSQGAKCQHYYLEALDSVGEYRHLVCRECGEEIHEGESKEFVPLTNPGSYYAWDKTATNKIGRYKVRDIMGEFPTVATNMYAEQTYSNRLAEPSSTVHNVDELAAALDYRAFYGDDSVFTVTLASDYPSPRIQTIHQAYFASRLCVSVVGLNYGYDASTKTFTVQMIFNPLANSASTASEYAERCSIPYRFDSAESRDPSFEDFPYLHNRTKGTLDVANSEQLLYALEEGYLPNVLPNTSGARLFEKAKQILRAIIKPDMTQVDKVLAIYAYLQSNNTYANTADGYAPYILEEVMFPDYVASHFRCFYAEGSLFDGYSVCQGYGKGFNILANMEGMDAIKVSARYENDTRTLCSNEYTAVDGEVTSAMYSSHGYSYVKYEGDQKYYICDPTYSLFTRVQTNSGVVYAHRAPAVMMGYAKWSELYAEPVDRFHLRSDVATKSLDLSAYNYFGSQPFTIPTIADVPSYMETLLSHLSSYNDPAYLTSNAFNVNLFCAEVNDSPAKLNDFFSAVVNQIYGYSYRYYASQTVYFSHNGGMVLLFDR